MGRITGSHDSVGSLERAFKQGHGLSYARGGYPEERKWEEKFADLVGAQDAALFNSGMAAISSIVMALLAELGEHAAIMVGEIAYAKTSQFFEHVGRFGENIVKIREDDINEPFDLTGITFLEAIGNGRHMPVIDVENLFRQLKESAGIVVLDNTFFSPVLFNPIELARKFGVESQVIVVESATKYYQCGRDKVTAGIIYGPAELIAKVKEFRAMAGTYLQPLCLDEFVYILNIFYCISRLAHISNITLSLASEIESHEKVANVWYPGLKSHPQHEIAQGLFKEGCGGVFYFEVKGGPEAAKKFCELSDMNIGVSFGHPDTWVIPIGIVDNSGTIRVAVGSKGNINWVRYRFIEALAQL